MVHISDMKGAALPLALGALGVGYFVVTQLRRPSPADPSAHAQWERHARDAKVGLIAGLAAAAILLASKPKKSARA